MPARPRYQQVKDLVRERIASGALAEGDPLPSEEALAATLGFSRLTVHRALRELTSEGIVLRFRRRGTFVAPLAPQSSAVTVEPIERQIALRGHRHGARLIELGALKADAALAARLELRTGTRVFRSRLVHLEDDVPIQLEERHVNPRVVPDYLSIDFATTTPAQYLQEHYPLREVEHVIVAETADAEIAALLDVPRGSACLTVLRRTWSNGRVATCARLVHPGSRFRLFNRFRPG
ncbi:MAG: histidine utilization repressor [Burkholderiales bacterium]|nr:MAG: histidine utilization repressor [Burkholderiales bacterium]